MPGPGFSFNTADDHSALSASILATIEALSSSVWTNLSTKFAKIGDSTTGNVGVENLSPNADLHVGAGNISIAGNVSVRIEPQWTSSVGGASPYDRAMIFHPLYNYTTSGGNAIGLQLIPEVSASKTIHALWNLYLSPVTNASTVITTYYGLYVDAKTGAGTIGTFYDAVFVGGGNVGIGTATPTSLLHVSGTFQLGASGSSFTNVRLMSPSLVPTSSLATLTMAVESFSVGGISTSDSIFINGPTQTSGIGMAGYRISATNTLEITWINLGAGTVSPASGSYKIIAFRS